MSDCEGLEYEPKCKRTEMFIKAQIGAISLSIYFEYDITVPKCGEQKAVLLRTLILKRVHFIEVNRLKWLM